MPSVWKTIRASYRRGFWFWFGWQACAVAWFATDGDAIGAAVAVLIAVLLVWSEDRRIVRLIRELAARRAPRGGASSE